MQSTRKILFSSLVLVTLLSSNGLAQSPSVAPMIKLIDSGRLPESRLPTVLGLVCKRGDAVDLQYIFAKTLDEKAFSASVREAALDLLWQATQDRKITPAGDLTQLKKLLELGLKKKDIKLQKQVIRLIGQWKVAPLSKELQTLLKDSTQKELTGDVITALAQLGGENANSSIAALTTSKHNKAVRSQAIQALAGIDINSAAKAAAAFLTDASKKESVGTINKVIQPFLSRKNGPELLGQEISKAKIDADVAKLALRAMLSAGRNDAPLSGPLSKAAGLDEKNEPLTKGELKALANQVLTKGNAKRGEQIFRREELSCYKCHAIGKAGGKVGPDLSPVGGSSPIDYLANALLLPSQAIKEAYKTRMVLDIDGIQHNGIVVDEDDNRIILRDAQGKETTIPVDDIDFEKEGDSLMPAGLTKFLTHDEFVDLVRFLSALGKDPEYTMALTPTVYRWRVFQSTPRKATGDLFSEETMHNQIFEYAPERWRPLYSLASGDLPIQEAKKISRNRYILAYCEVEVSAAGHVKLGLNSSDGIMLWNGHERIEPDQWGNVKMAKGKNRLLLRIDTDVYTSQKLRLTVEKGKAPAAEYSIVVGE